MTWTFEMNAYGIFVKNFSSGLFYLGHTDMDLFGEMPFSCLTRKFIMDVWPVLECNSVN